MVAVDTAIITGWFSPFLTWHATLVNELLRRHETVTLSLLTRIENPAQYSWPTFSELSEDCFFTLWERIHLIRLAVTESITLDADRVVVTPIYAWNNELLFNNTFFPKTRAWYFLRSEYRWAALQLLSRGESITFLDPPEEYVSSQRIASDLSSGHFSTPYLSKLTRSYLRTTHIDLRLKELYQTRESQLLESKSGAGMHFYGNVTVVGNIVQVAGDQYNFQYDSKTNVLNAIGEIVKAGLAGADIAPLLRPLSDTIETRQDISKEDIVDAVGTVLIDQRPSRMDALIEVLDQLILGASGSLLATAIVEGIKLYLGR